MLKGKMRNEIDGKYIATRKKKKKKRKEVNRNENARKMRSVMLKLVR